MSFIGSSYSSFNRPIIRGRRGAVASAHPLATAAGQALLAAGGSAADALIAAQAVLAVIAPDACGLGGDMLALVASGGKDVVAVTGAGRAPFGMRTSSQDGANSITVPGLVGSWQTLSRRWGAVPLAQCLAPAVELAESGFIAGDALVSAVDAQRSRLLAGGAAQWVLLGASIGDTVLQPELGQLLRKIGDDGESAFYQGASAAAIERAVSGLGGTLSAGDLIRHTTETSAPIAIKWGPWTVHVQPPPTQGILLAMALQARATRWDEDRVAPDHLCIELTEAAFAYRSRCGEGSTLLAEDLSVDLQRASRRGGPRAYLHTAGVAACDASGLTLSSLVSVFDDFGSGVFVPELGIALNNRGGGFTDGPNAPAPGKRPVHTLAPILLSGPDGTLALATPGADGQVQTLLQVLDRIAYRSASLGDAITAPRWRSEGGRLLIEEDHPEREALESLGHDLRVLPPGDMRFGAVVAAGCETDGPFAIADWRRECWSGVA